MKTYDDLQTYYTFAFASSFQFWLFSREWDTVFMQWKEKKTYQISKKVAVAED